MDGYLVNASPGWAHAMKRTIGPGAKVPLSELYEQYGVKHNLEEGDQFINWLQEVKLKDKNKWKIVLSEEVPVEVDKEEEKKVKPNRREDLVTPPVSTTKLEVKDIVELSVRKAREIIPTIMDLNLLKYAMNEANQKPGKDSLCIVLRKRILELQQLAH